MSYTANKLRTLAKRRLVDFDPDATTAVVATLDPGNSAKCLPIGDAAMCFLVGAFKSVGAGDIDLLEIITADAADGTGNVSVIASKADTVADADAVGDTSWLEVAGEQIKAEMAATNAYIGVRLTLATGTDECVVYAEAHGRVAKDGLTADYIA